MPSLWRCALIAALVLSITSFAFAQQDADPPKQPIGRNLTDVVELLEDGTDFFIDNLDNGGGQDGSVASRNDQTLYSGKCSLCVTPFHRFRPAMPGWNFPIKENPEVGEFRYVRFAWKRTEAPGVLLQLFTRKNQWEGYYAGTLSTRIKRPMVRIADEPPREWQMVTRDLFTDFGPITITGINFSAMEGGGEAYYDHIYLARTIEDLDGVTKRLTKDVEPNAPPQQENTTPIPWAQLIAILGALLILFIAGLLLILIVRRATNARHLASSEADAKSPTVAIACQGCGRKLKVRAKAGTSVKCPTCGANVVLPQTEAST